MSFVFVLIFYACSQKFVCKVRRYITQQCDADETVIPSRCLIRISGQDIARSLVFRKASTLVEKNKRKKTIGTHRGGQLTNETGKHEGEAGDDLRGPSFPHSNVPTMPLNNKPAGGSPGMII